MSDLSVNSILDASGGTTTTINGFTPTVSNMAGRNRLINSDMRIDQRNAGASVTVNTAALNYTLDRWAAFGQATDGVFTAQKSTTVPTLAGFTNSLIATCTTADTSLSATNRYFLNQNIEGNNSADLQFGSAGAKAVTLSFWVRSSLTGTYCAAILNGGGTRSYVAEYTISVADTWEYKTITVQGDTTGTWSTDNTTGITLRFALAGGSTYQTTANAWAAGNFNTTSNQVNWMSSSSSRTFYITGVQLEAGSVATPFEHRQYGQELALCQRYYYKSPQQANGEGFITYQATGGWTGTTCFPVTMRATPTMTYGHTSPYAGNTFLRVDTGGTITVTLGQHLVSVSRVMTIYDGGKSSIPLGTNFSTYLTASAEL